MLSKAIFRFLLFGSIDSWPFRSWALSANDRRKSLLPGSEQWLEFDRELVGSRVEWVVAHLEQTAIFPAMHSR
jgi:hypothetical protein